jgi:LysR family transcriptional regulator, glycine cleavage system transcriptional activator
MNKLPPMPELQAFAAVVRHLSFKKAAAELGVTPTAISHQIRLLEGHCGHALFRRRPRPLALTEAGAKLAPYVLDGLEALRTGMAAVRRVEEKQFLRVTTTNAFASRWLVPRLPLWSQAHPETPLEVIGTDGVVDLDAGDADVAIRYATGRKPPAHGVYEELVTDCFWPVCSPQLLTSGRPPAQISDLKGQVLVHAYWAPTDLDPPTWQAWLATARSHGHEVPSFNQMEHLSFREELHAIEAVIAAQGFGMLSSVLVGAELAKGTLVKAFDLPLPGYGFYVLRRSHHPREAAIRKFSAWLKSVA